MVDLARWRRSGPRPAGTFRLGMTAAVVAAAAVVTAAEGPRTWRDATGKFEIEARLVDRTETAVRLKKSDGKVIEVPLEKLGKADREYLRKLDAVKQAEPPPADPFAAEGTAEPKWVVRRPKTPRPEFPRAGGPPAEENAILPSTGRLVPVATDVAPKGLEPDPYPPLAPLVDGGLIVAEAGGFTEASPPLLLDPEKMLVAVALTRDAGVAGDDGAARIYVAPLPNGPAKMVWEDPKSLRLLDHDAASDRTLVVSGMGRLGAGGEIVVIEGLAKGQPTEILRRRPPARPGTGADAAIHWGRLLDGETMLAVVDDQVFAWNLVSAEMLFTTGKLPRKAGAALSPGRRYLAVPIEKGVAFLDPVKGVSLGYVAASGRSYHAAHVCFHPDGERVAVIDDRQTVVYDLVAGEETANFQLDGQGGLVNHGDGPVGWVDDHLLLGSDGHLVRTDLGAVLWEYDFGPDYAVKTVAVPGGVLVSGKDRAFGLMALKLPNRAAIRAAALLDTMADELFLTKAGMEVGLTTDLVDGADRERALEALRKTVETAGWKVTSNAAVTVAGIVRRGTPRPVSYTKSRGFFPGPNKPGDPGPGEETVLVTPFVHSIEVRLGREVIWKYEGFEKVPVIVRHKEGESTQAAVARENVPDYGQFESMEIPTRIPRREFRKGLGKSAANQAQWQDRWLIAPPPGAAGPRRRGPRPANAR